MLNDNKPSFAAGDGYGFIEPAPGNTNTDNNALLFCGRCEDALAPVITNRHKIAGLYCLTCRDRVPVRRGYVVTRPPLAWRMGWHLSRFFAEVRHEHS